MTKKRMIELLEIEQKCVLKASKNGCDGNCENCELVQKDKELLEMYASVLQILKAIEEI